MYVYQSRSFIRIPSPHLRTLPTLPFGLVPIQYLNWWWYPLTRTMVISEYTSVHLYGILTGRSSTFPLINRQQEDSTSCLSNQYLKTGTITDSSIYINVSSTMSAHFTTIQCECVSVEDVLDLIFHPVLLHSVLCSTQTMCMYFYTESLQLLFCWTVSE